jgi:predicted nucleic acid-binding protein
MGSQKRELFRKGIENQFLIVTSDSMLKELTRVLGRPKFKTNPDEIRRITLALLSSAEVVNVKTKLKLSRRTLKMTLSLKRLMMGTLISS